MLKNIQYNYVHCSPVDFNHDLSFDEKFFTDILSECQLINPNIIKFEVFLEMKKSQSTGKFCCAVLVHLPRSTELYVKEESNENYAQTCIKSCNKTVKEVREEHEKSMIHISMKDLENELEQIE